MSSLYYIIVALVAGGLFGLSIFVSKKTSKSAFALKLVSLILAGVFVFRYMLNSDAIQTMFKLSNTPIAGKGKNLLALILVWLTYSSNILIILYPFFDIKELKGIITFLAVPVSVVNLIMLPLNFTAIMGANTINVISVRGVLFAIEIGLVFGYSLFIAITQMNWKKLFASKNKNDKKENAKVQIVGNKTRGAKFKQWFINVGATIGRFFKKYYLVILLVVIILLSTMPSYTIQAVFGECKTSYTCKDFQLPHRIILYIGIIIPILLHTTLKNQKYDVKKFSLLFICLGTLLSFSITRRFETFEDITRWPLHLCNTAMYIMPLVLIFKWEKFFYFTYFINVVGALVAMMMPNYDIATNMFSRQLVDFYINHYIAFFMPILIVSLGIFKKPKIKEFTYSMIAFAVYFALVLVINATFSGLFELGRVSRATDFFFLNSDYVADQLGKWCEDLRNITSVITIKGVRLVFYPLYQTLFFIAYVGIGLVEWFLYEHFFEIAKASKDIRKRKEKIKLDTLALMQKLDGRSMKEPMNPENGNKLLLKNFSKKYGSSSQYAVKDANLEVVGGEIFGFLGPNGAGKSTIIKSVVGIQPITEGSIEVCGYDVDTQGVEAKRQIGFVPDHYALYEKLTGREYINYIADLYDVSVEDRNKRIEGYVKRFRLENAFDNQMKTYSHGMKQKIAIMAALVHNPKVWILDEPLTGLDPDSIFQVKECMKEHKENGNIVFFSSHIIDVVERICDRIAIIKKGNILVCKSIEEIEKSGITLEQFYMNTINGENNNETSEKSASTKQG